MGISCIFGFWRVALQTGNFSERVFSTLSTYELNGDDFRRDPLVVSKAVLATLLSEGNAEAGLRRGGIAADKRSILPLYSHPFGRRFLSGEITLGDWGEDGNRGITKETA